LETLGVDKATELQNLRDSTIEDMKQKAKAWVDEAYELIMLSASEQTRLLRTQYIVYTVLPDDHNWSVIDLCIENALKRRLREDGFSSVHINFLLHPNRVCLEFALPTK
jgi:hypothetical protein